jgi:hypothetical protein
MKTLGELFPIMMVIIGLYDLWRSFEDAGGGYAIAAALMFGTVLLAGRLRKWARGEQDV